ncbi:MAG: hypothetical protein J5I90_18225 [Caldilineales bacterium]|nr:hypothetical protein [Caldilineales bacterium]
MQNAPNLQAGIRFLAEGGLNLFAILDCAGLPDGIRRMMTEGGAPLAEYRRLVLIGHGGRRLWQALQETGMARDDPIDHYSVDLAGQFMRDYLGDAPTFWLYPGTEVVIPLQRLGEAAGWCYSSPLGSGISPVYGVWFAYRAAFLLDADLPEMRQQPAPSPCNACADKPCITVCPVDAVQMSGLDVETCARHRIRPQSPCADRCLARMACPYFPEHRYTLPQIQYHYGISLPTLRAWFGGE